MVDIILEVADWNEERGCTTFDGSLEYEMLLEELNEFMYAYPKTLTDKFGVLEEEEFTNKESEILEYLKTEEFYYTWKTHQADALTDLAFVVLGSLFKLTGDHRKVEDIFQAVIAANNTKTADKNGSGKIVKPDGFIPPEGIIKKILMSNYD